MIIWNRFVVCLERFRCVQCFHLGSGVLCRLCGLQFLASQATASGRRPKYHPRYGEKELDEVPVPEPR